MACFGDTHIQYGAESDIFYCRAHNPLIYNITLPFISERQANTWGAATEKRHNEMNIVSYRVSALRAKFMQMSWTLYPIYGVRVLSPHSEAASQTSGHASSASDACARPFFIAVSAEFSSVTDTPNRSWINAGALIAFWSSCVPR